MKEAVIYAYLVNNLGDDLMVYTLLKRYPQVHFHLYAGLNYKDVFRDVSNFTIHYPEDPRIKKKNELHKKLFHVDNWYWKKLLKRIGTTIHIGGSCFVQHSDDFRAFIDSDRSLRKNSPRLYGVGMNFGPYRDPQFYKEYHELFRTYDGLTFRDQRSHHLFEDLPNVRSAPDVVFQYPTKSYASTPQKKQVLFSVISLAGRHNLYAGEQDLERYRTFILSLAQLYLEEGYDLQFLSFCGLQGDETEIEYLTNQIDPAYRDRVHSLYYRGDIDACMTAFAESEIVVGTRFHSIILGWLFGKTVLPVIYDEKTANLLSDLSCPVGVKINELDRPAFWKDAAAQAGVLDISEMIRKAPEQFWALDNAFC